MTHLDFRNCDAFELMRSLPDASIDCLITDPPYGLMDAAWDVAPDWNEFWSEVHRVCKPEATMVVFGLGLHMVDVIHANRKNYRYTVIWEKTMPTGVLSTALRPLAQHEEIGVFGRQPVKSVYNPQKHAPPPGHHERRKYRSGNRSELYNGKGKATEYLDDGSRHPSTIIIFKNNTDTRVHPTQKPEKLMEYLVLTYSNPGQTILDPYAGSGTTGVAALRHGRNFIGCEINPEYYPTSKARLEGTNLNLFSMPAPEPKNQNSPEPEAPPVLFEMGVND